MNRYLPIALVVCVVLGIFIWLGQRNKDKHDWAETYDLRAASPTGLPSFAKY
jgi:hypothetical protein